MQREVLAALTPGLNRSGIGATIAVILVVLLVGSATADLADPAWQMASRDVKGGLDLAVYVEAKKSPGRPAFRVETAFDVSPAIAAATLMGSMASEDSATAGESRKILERTENVALVHTYIDLPFMFSDRELAIRVEHSRDSDSGIHRIDWKDANEVLPAPDDGVLRLATVGYWEFRPTGPGKTSASYVTRAEVGGSLPAAVGDRMMKRQAVDAVKRLARLLGERRAIDVAAPPPIPIATE